LANTDTEGSHGPILSTEETCESTEIDHSFQEIESWHSLGDARQARQTQNQVRRDLEFDLRKAIPLITKATYLTKTIFQDGPHRKAHMDDLKPYVRRFGRLETPKLIEWRLGKSA
jgi:hypothetical protein